ncbi:MAG: FtsX-like permease family protein [Anaerolineae bacterium]|nr:FtsX-like permease family protein [Anaerolineae bacterium]
MIIDIRWQKVFRDLWDNKARTLLVALAIAVGVFAFGVVANARGVILSELEREYIDSSPATAIMTVSPFDDSLVDFVSGLRQVEVAEGRYETVINLEESPGNWKSFNLYAISDFDDIEVAKFTPESGQWPPRRREVLLERSSYNIPDFPTGETLHIELADGSTQDLTVVGTVHDVVQFPAENYGEGYGYISFDTLNWLIGSRDYNKLYIALNDTSSRSEIEHTITDIQERIENEGYIVSSSDIPKTHWGMNIITTLVVVLGVIGAFSLILSGFLVINTTSAILQQQTKQIGMMKTIGARSKQLLVVYLASMLVYGLMAVCISVPLGVIGAQTFARFVAGRINFDIVNFTLSPTILFLQIFIGLIVPPLAAVIPILRGTWITAREAIYDQQSSDALQKKGDIDRLIEKLRGLPRPLMLSLRNTFRRRGRLRLTLGTLIIASSVFIAIFSVRTGMLTMVYNIFHLMEYDVAVDFQTDQPIDTLLREARRIDGVQNCEAWNINKGQHIRDDGSEGQNVTIFGLPPDSRYSNPIIEEGRWLNSGNVNEVVFTKDILIDNPEMQIGKEITLEVDGEEETLVIVGAVSPLGSPTADGFAFITDTYYQSHWGTRNYARRLIIETSRHTQDFQLDVAQALSDHFKDSVDFPVTQTTSIISFRNGITSNFNIIIILLFVVALLLAVVGGLGLAGTMSLNVLERTREIAVMRAVGATNFSVWGIVIAEGIVISLISSLFGALLAYPVGLALNRAVGMAFIDGPFDYYYSLEGVTIWAIFSIILAIISCWTPAFRAVQISVREALAYE